MVQYELHIAGCHIAYFLLTTTTANIILLVSEQHKCIIICSSNRTGLYIFLPPAAHHKRSWNTGKNSFPWFQVTLFFRVLAHSALYMTGKNGVLNGQFSRSAQRNTNPDGGIKQTWERKLEMRFRGKNKTVILFIH